MPNTELVKYESDSGVATLTLNSPPANCYSYEMMQELDAAILRARFDNDVHVIVLTGTGNKFFCAGADIKTLNDVTPEFKYYFCLHANETLNRLESTPKLTIAALNGHCVGGGLEVALACDLRVAKAGRGRLGLPEVKLGVLPGTGGTQRLVRILGKSKSIEWMADGELRTFEQGLEAGILNAVWSEDEFDSSFMEYVRKFCPPEGASKAIGFIKRSVTSGSEMGLAEGLSLERELQQQLFNSSDAKEGIRAYVESRAPKFEGR